MRSEEKRLEKRSAILKAAHDEFKDRRFDEVKLDAIAARAGVGKGTLYLYFKNKEDLFLQLAIDGIDEMAARVAEVLELDLPYRERFFLLGEELISFFQKRAGMVRMMHQRGADHVFQQFHVHRRVLKSAMHGFLERGVRDGVLRDDVAVADIHLVLVGPMLLRGRLLEDGEAVSASAALNIIWDGIAKR